MPADEKSRPRCEILSLKVEQKMPVPVPGRGIQMSNSAVQAQRKAESPGRECPKQNCVVRLLSPASSRKEKKLRVEDCRPDKRQSMDRPCARREWAGSKKQGARSRGKRSVIGSIHVDRLVPTITKSNRKQAVSIWQGVNHQVESNTGEDGWSG